MEDTKEHHISFHITDSMVERFAGLVGDTNPLHMKEDVAATSAYRERIAHGFLPLCFLVMMKTPDASQQWRLGSLQAQFQKPIFLGDSLTLQTNMQENGEFSFALRNQKSKEVVAKGKGELVANELPMPTLDKDATEQGLLKDGLQERTMTMQEIQEGMTHSMHFLVSQGALAGLALVLKEGLEQEEVSLGFSPTELLALSLCSPSVGMVMPGTHATLHAFEAVLKEPIALSAPLEFAENVSFVSPGTQSLKKEFTIGSGVKGTITAGIRSERTLPPSFAEIKEKAKDTGLEGKTVLITGANRGIGATSAMLFAALGAKVVINYLQGKDEAEKLVDDIAQGGGKALCLQADITSKEQVQEMVEKINESFGPVDVLVNNAVRDFLPKDFLSTHWDDMQKDLDVALKGAFHCCQAVLPGMIKKGEGRIITMGSVAADVPPARHSKYVVSKSGLLGLTRALAVEYAKDNILVNMVVPSMVETDLIAHIPEGFKKKIAAESPLGRYATPLDVARAVVFLASGAASFTTGQRIMVTGGAPPFL